MKLLLLTPEFLQLALSEVLFVGRLSVEGQRVEWELRVSLMEDIGLSIVPVGETGLVGAHLDDGLGLLSQLLVLGLCFDAFFALVGLAVGSS